MANFQPQESAGVLQQLLDRLDETARGPLVFQKYIAQLRVLVQLRTSKPLLEAAMDNLINYVNEQNGPFYVKGRNLGYLLGTEKGIQEGETKAQFQLIKNLLVETDFTDAKIAHLTGATVSIVKNVRRQLADD